jgi:hypothetical protein
MIDWASGKRATDCEMQRAKDQGNRTKGQTRSSLLRVVFEDVLHHEFVHQGIVRSSIEELFKAVFLAL